MDLVAILTKFHSQIPRSFQLEKSIQMNTKKLKEYWFWPIGDTIETHFLKSQAEDGPTS